MTDQDKAGRGNRPRYDDKPILREICLYIATRKPPYVVNNEIVFQAAFKAAVEGIPNIHTKTETQLNQMKDRIWRKFDANKDALLAAADATPKTLWGAPAFSTLLTAPDLPEIEEAQRLRAELLEIFREAADGLFRYDLHEMSDKDRENLVRYMRSALNHLKLKPG